MNEKEIEELNLFDTAARVKAALTPAIPRPAFVAELKRRLMREAHEQQTERRQRWLFIAAGAGSLMYVLGVLALGLRTSLWLVSLVALILGWKKRAATLHT